MKNITLKLFLVPLITFCILSCDTEENEESLVDEVKISSYNIVDNTINGVSTKTELEFHNTSYDNIVSYGIKWFRKSKKEFYEKEYTGLQSSFFDASITEKLLKDSIYKTFSFVKFKDKIITSDTLEFISNFTTPIVIDSIYPKNGFIYDTLTVKGKNFCDSEFRNLIYFNGGGYRPFSVSDSIMKVVIPPYLKTSNLSLGVRTCAITKNIKDIYTINAPILDSIESKERYVGEVLKLYGKNLHHSISELWLDNIKTEIKYTDYKDTLLVIVPKGLSKGKVDLKLKVLDRITEKKSFYQTTSPYIISTIPETIGFFDIVTIKGNYFKQGNEIPRVTIGGSNQTLLSYNKEEIKILVNRYFYTSNPELKIEINGFVDVATVKMRAPKILEFGKPKYHFTDEVVIKTDAFIDRNNLKIGNTPVKYGNNYQIDDDGAIKISLNEWLHLNTYYPSFVMEEEGKLKVELENQFGYDSSMIQIYPPQINSLDKKVYMYADNVTIKGNDFGYGRINKIYIDGELVTNPNNSSYTVKNTEIKFRLGINTTPGTHRLYVEVGGQKSNEVEYEIEKSEVHSVSKNEATRKDNYIVYGDNIERLSIKANGENCENISSSPTKSEFKFPYYRKLEGDIKITGSVGDQKFDIATLKGVEPHNLINNTLDNINLLGTCISGSNFKDWYFINYLGVFKFNHSSEKWDMIDNNPPPFSTFMGEERVLTVTDAELILPLNEYIYKYDIINKSWTSQKNDIFVNKGILIGDILYGMDYSKLYEYNVKTKEKIYREKFNTYNYETVTYGDNKIFVNPWQGQVFYFDIITKQFNYIGRPRNHFGTYQNVALKYYNDKLYYIGGLTDGGKEHRIYEYDFTENNWKEKTPMLIKGFDNSIHIKDGVFYIGLGKDLYGYDNKTLNKYYINKDLY